MAQDARAGYYQKGEKRTQPPGRQREVIGGENVKNNFARIEGEELHSKVHGLA
jgi:hypothetical protein